MCGEVFLKSDLLFQIKTCIESKLVLSVVMCVVFKPWGSKLVVRHFGQPFRVSALRMAT